MIRDYLEPLGHLYLTENMLKLVLYYLEYSPEASLDIFQTRSLFILNLCLDQTLVEIDTIPFQLKQSPLINEKIIYLKGNKDLINNTLMERKDFTNVKHTFTNYKAFSSDEEKKILEVYHYNLDKTLYYNFFMEKQNAILYLTDSIIDTNYKEPAVINNFCSNYIERNQISLFEDEEESIIIEMLALADLVSFVSERGLSLSLNAEPCAYTYFLDQFFLNDLLTKFEEVSSKKDDIVPLVKDYKDITKFLEQLPKHKAAVVNELEIRKKSNRVANFNNNNTTFFDDFFKLYRNNIKSVDIHTLNNSGRFYFYDSNASLFYENCVESLPFTHLNFLNFDTQLLKLRSETLNNNTKEIKEPFNDNYSILKSYNYNFINKLRCLEFRNYKNILTEKEQEVLKKTYDLIVNNKFDLKDVNYKKKDFIEHLDEYNISLRDHENLPIDKDGLKNELTFRDKGSLDEFLFLTNYIKFDYLIKHPSFIDGFEYMYVNDLIYDTSVLDYVQNVVKTHGTVDNYISSLKNRDYSPKSIQDMVDQIKNSKVTEHSLDFSECSDIDPEKIKNYNNNNSIITENLTKQILSGKDNIKKNTVVVINSEKKKEYFEEECTNQIFSKKILNDNKTMFAIGVVTGVVIVSVAYYYLK